MSEKRFKIVNDCGDYHLLNGDEQLGYDLCSYSMRKANWNNVVDLLNEQEEELMMQREKALYWRNKAENIWGDMKTNIELQDENKKLKKRIKSKERVIKTYEDYIKTLKEDGVLDD